MNMIHAFLDLVDDHFVKFIVTGGAIGLLAVYAAHVAAHAPV